MLRQFADIATRIEGFSKRFLMAPQSAFISPRGTNVPVTSGRTSSGIPPTSKPTTGVPQAKDSRTVFRLACHPLARHHDVELILLDLFKYLLFSSPDLTRKIVMLVGR